MERSLVTNYTPTKFQKIEFFLGIINRMLIGFVTIYVTFLSLRSLKNGDVPWHALLCTIGFKLLMTEGILSYYKGNSTTYNWFRREKVILHITLQLLGSLFGITGMIFRMTIDKFHFTTLHGKLGLVAFVLCLISLLCGLSALYSTRMKKYLQPFFSKTIHGLLGILTYAVGIVCLIYGYDTNVFGLMSQLEGDSLKSTILILKLATIGSLIITIYGPLGTAIYKLWNYLR
ncbi:uncharacterized protein LOC129915236 [Episyrphus balteatus]|uniref:uncharacterized protein LOC129915236 n=1 Tax=Episyrphus balteatus TaxID=286459 RepID=UPI0024856566|nr:uncharacterized protein LOC129915236 [Episyrphus balteatus]